MALKLITGFELGSTSDFTNAALSGTASFVTSPVRTGTYALRTNPTTTGTGSADFISQVDNTNGNLQVWDLADVYIEFQFRAAAFPGLNDEPIFQLQTIASALKLEVRVNSSGNLVIYDQALGLVATGTSVLSTGTWYRIGVRGGTGAASTYEVRINGTTESTGTADQTASNSARMRLGKSTNRNGQTVDFFFDDVSVSSTAFLGSFEVKLGTVTGNGSTMQWVNGTGGTGTSDYQQVDEVPPSDTDYVESVAQNDVALFAFQDASVIGVSGTIHAVSVHVRLQESTDPCTFAVRFRSGSTNSDSATQSPGGSVLNKNRMLETDPATSAAWTTSGIDGVEGGAVQSNTGIGRLMFAGMMVAYTPVTNIAPTPGVGSEVLHGLAPGLGFTINMPDQPTH